MDRSKYIGEVQGLGKIYQDSAPLNRSISRFKELGIKYPYLPGVDEVAQIRLAGLSNDYSRTNLLPLKVKDEKTVLKRISPFMDSLMCEMIIDAHRKGKYHELSKAVYDAVKESAHSQEGLEPEDRDAIILSHNGEYSITPEMDEARFILRRFNEDYFKTFKHISIPIWDLPEEEHSKGNCIVNHVWFYRSAGGSGLSLRSRGLDSDLRAFGVLRSEAEGGAEPRRKICIL